MDSQKIKNILNQLKNLPKGKFFSVLNSILIVLLGAWIFMDSKPIDESAYLKLYDKIDSLKIENVELKTLIIEDSTAIRLKQLENSLIEKTNQVEDELAKLIEEQNISNDNILHLSSDKLFQFFAEYDTSHILEPYIIVVD